MVFKFINLKKKTK